MHPEQQTQPTRQHLPESKMKLNSMDRYIHKTTNQEAEAIQYDGSFESAKLIVDWLHNHRITKIKYIYKEGLYLNEFLIMKGAYFIRVIDNNYVATYSKQAFFHTFSPAPMSTQPKSSEMKSEKLIYSFNPNDNGGEQLTASVEVSNGSTYVEFELQSHCNSASIYASVVTPEKLRELADKIESFALEQNKENIKTKALAKLTPEEIKALGLSTDEPIL
jgi:hypothetical protein